MAVSYANGVFIGKDLSWKHVLDKEIVVETFLPFAELSLGKVKRNYRSMPFAFLKGAYPDLRDNQSNVYLPIMHKLDFHHLWELYKVRKVTPKEEVIVEYTNNYRGRKRLFNGHLPHLVIYVYPKGAISKGGIEELRKNPRGEETMLIIMKKYPCLAHWEPEGFVE
jgi:hypothetical protein